MRYTIILCTLIVVLGCQKTKENINPPLSPSTLTATPQSTSQIDLSWTDNSTSEEGFKLERKTGVEAYKEIATINKDITTYQDKGLSKATSYTYRVYAFNNGGKSPTYTNEATASTLDDIPSAASELTITAITSNSIVLNWKDNAVNESGYKIERKTGSNTFTIIATLNANTVTYKDEELSENMEYTYRVYPINSFGNGAYSNEVKGITPININNLSWNKIFTGDCLNILLGNQPNLMFLIRRTDVLKSIDEGINWTNVNWPLGIVRSGTSCISGSAFSNFGSGQLVVAALDNGWFTSNDLGQSFQQSGPTGFGTGAPYITPLSDGRFLSGQGGFLRGIYKSSGNTNTTWLQKTGGVDIYCFGKSNSEDKIIACGSGPTPLSYSLDKGETWTPLINTQQTIDFTCIMQDSILIVDRSGSVSTVKFNYPLGNIVQKATISANDFHQGDYSEINNLLVISGGQSGLFVSFDKGNSFKKYQFSGVINYYQPKVIGKYIYMPTDMGIFRSQFKL